MNILSLFDGMSCGIVAADRAGLIVDNYYASEIDKHAQIVSRANHKKIIRLGDVTKWIEWDIDWSSIDLLIGGSPCQGFSLAGKQLAFNDPRSRLFFVYVDILNHIKSANKNVKFLLENVKMKKEHLDVISSHVGVEPIYIDSEVVSACHRPRFYWANFKIKQPDRKKISFMDIIDLEITDNEMSDSWHEWWQKNKSFQCKKAYSKINVKGEKGICMTTRQYASWNGNFIQMKSGRIRKPTKNELAMLVGLPTGYLDSVSQRQAEILTGNGWTIDVIAHILKHLNKEI